MPQNMFEIYDGRTSFWQWDTGQKLIVLDETVDQVHFSNKAMSYAIIKEVYTEEGIRMCDIPDEVLSASENLIAYAYVVEEDNNKTVCAVTFSVRSRPVPEDYVCEVTDRFKDIVDKIESVEDLVEKLSAGSKFTSFEDAEEWARKEKKSGAIISVYVDGQWSAYMVEDDYTLAPVMKYDEALSSVYVQDVEPADAAEGDVWVDTSNDPVQFKESDPTVPAWAKAESKPSYTAEEVGADTKGSASDALNAAKKYADGILTDAKLYADGAVQNANAYAGNVIQEAINSEKTRIDELLVDKVDKVDGKSLSENDLTDKLKSNYDNAYTHSQSKHAPANAQENVIENIKVNGEALKVTDKTVDIVVKDIAVPTKVSELENDKEYITADLVGDINELKTTNKNNIVEAINELVENPNFDKEGVPDGGGTFPIEYTKLSEFENDVGFITEQYYLDNREFYDDRVTGEAFTLQTIIDPANFSLTAKNDSYDFFTTLEERYEMVDIKNIFSEISSENWYVIDRLVIAYDKGVWLDFETGEDYIVLVKTEISSRYGVTSTINVYNRDGERLIGCIGRIRDSSGDISYDWGYIYANSIIPIPDISGLSVINADFIFYGLIGGFKKIDNKFVDIQVATKVSELENDSGYITLNEVYVPTKVSELENDSKYITLDEVPEIPEVYVPTKVSELENDSKYITEQYYLDNREFYDENVFNKNSTVSIRVFPSPLETNPTQFRFLDDTSNLIYFDGIKNYDTYLNDITIDLNEILPPAEPSEPDYWVIVDKLVVKNKTDVWLDFETGEDYIVLAKCEDERTEPSGWSKMRGRFVVCNRTGDWILKFNGAHYVPVTGQLHYDDVSLVLNDNFITMPDAGDSEYIYLNFEIYTAERAFKKIDNKFIDLEVPTKVSELENDSGFITADDLPEIPEVEIPEGIITEERFTTQAENEEPTYGEELASADGWTADGWTGDFSNGFTHTTGNTNSLIFTMPEDTAQNTYRISFRCSESIAVEALMVKCGGSELFDLYGQPYNPVTLGIVSVENSNLEFVPASTFKGTITDISIKRVTGFNPTKQTITDSTGEISCEMRTTKANLDNVFIGKHSGENNISGVGCAAVGSSALKSNTSGFWNVGVGHNALRDNTVGSRNIGIGYIALAENVTGIRNVALGTFALNHNKTGNKNIAIGADCLDKNVSGSFNVGVGFQSLYSNETGNQNVAIGAMALKAVTGNANVGIGYSAGAAITTGSNNFALGVNSLYKLKTGNDNVAIGAQAGRGQGTTTGFNYGVFIGRQTGYNLCDNANANVFIGNKAGYTVTTGGDNICIGSDANTPTPTTSRWVNIGGLYEGSAKSTDKYAKINGGLQLSDIPTADPAIAGRVWNDNGTLKVSAG